MRGLIHALPPEQREVLVLVCIEDLSYRDGAEVLGIPIGTVMSRLSRARAALGGGQGVGAVCRTFELRTDDRKEIVWHEVACRHEGVWETELAVADRVNFGGTETFSPASDGIAQSIDSYLDAIGASESLDEDAERELRNRGWSTNG